MGLLFTGVTSASANEKMEQDNSIENSEFFQNLDDDLQEEVLELNEALQEDIEELRAGVDMESLDEDEKQEHKDNIEALMTQYQEDMMEILEDDEDALAAFEEMLEKRNEKGGQKQNGEKQNDEKQGAKKEAKNTSTWYDSGTKTSAKNTYKAAFAKKIGTKLATLSDEKLETIATKIEILIENYEANDDISDTKKEKVLAQLEALAELIEEALDDDIDFDSLLED